jgi:hypothetical protein
MRTAPMRRPQARRRDPELEETLGVAASGTRCMTSQWNQKQNRHRTSQASGGHTRHFSSVSDGGNVEETFLSRLQTE